MFLIPSTVPFPRLPFSTLYSCSTVLACLLFFLADLPLRPPLLTWRDSESPWLPFLSLQMSAAAGSMATLWTLPTYFLGNP